MTSGRNPEVDAAAITRMATAHLARYSASSAGLRMVLARKIRRRFDRAGAAPPDPDVVSALLDDVVAKLTQAGLLDDAAFGRARARRLTEKGLSGARIRRDLRAEGLCLGDQDDGIGVDDEAQAWRFATRKRLGPFRTGPRAPYRDRDIRALLRAGFSPRLASAVVDRNGVDPEENADA